MICFVQDAKAIRDDNVIRLPFADDKTALIADADVGAAAAAWVGLDGAGSSNLEA